MTQLAPEDMAILDLLSEAKLDRESVPIPRRRIIGHFEKYAFPIGVDDAGKLFPLPMPRRDETGR